MTGQRVAALVTANFYDRAIEALEDAEDLAAARAALNKDGPSIPWDVVKARPRARVTYRVIYSVEDDLLLVLVVSVRQRREAYAR